MNQLNQFDGSTFSAALDGERLTSQLERVKNVMAFGGWWTLKDLALICQGSEASISSRIRDLRKIKFGSYSIERRRLPQDPKAGVWQYRMKMPIQFDQNGQGVFA